MRAEDVYERIVDRVTARFGSSVTATLVRVTPSLLTHEGTDLQGLLTPHAAPPHTGAASFATDGGNLAELGMEPLVFGPGSIEVAHKADEYVERAALERAVDVIEDVVRKRCT